MTTTDQRSEALRLAGQLHNMWLFSGLELAGKAAAELRRLAEENERLKTTRTCAVCGNANCVAGECNDDHPLSDAPQPAAPTQVEVQGCSCEWCQGLCNGGIQTRMALCPECGNKRCPKATNHANACTGSNAVGQPGSSWEHVKSFSPSQDEKP